MLSRALLGVPGSLRSPFPEGAGLESMPEIPGVNPEEAEES